MKTPKRLYETKYSISFYIYRTRPFITKNLPIYFDPLKPYFYIVKQGFNGVYIIFLILLKNINCGYLLEPPFCGGSNQYPQSMFWAEIWKVSEFFTWKFSFFGGEIFNIFESACFCNGYSSQITRSVRLLLNEVINSFTSSRLFYLKYLDTSLSK